MLRLLAIATLAACQPTVAKIIDPGLDSQDTGAEPDSDTDTDIDTDTDTDTDTDPPGLQWEGRLQLTAGGCEAEILEYGEDVSREPEWAEAVDAMGNCEMLYLLELTPPEACGLSPPAPELRCLKWRGAHVDVYEMVLAGGGWAKVPLDEDGEVVDKWEFVYAFTWNGVLTADAWAVLD